MGIIVRQLVVNLVLKLVVVTVQENVMDVLVVVQDVL